MSRLHLLTTLYVGNVLLNPTGDILVVEVRNTQKHLIEYFKTFSHMDACVGTRVCGKSQAFNMFVGLVG